MNNKMYEILEFNKVLNILKEYALSEKAKGRIEALEPLISESDVKRNISETTEARIIIENCGTPPLSAMNDLEKSLVLLEKGGLLMPEQLENIAQFFTSCRRLKEYLKKAEGRSTSVAAYGNSIYDLSHIENEISRIVRGSRLDDRASPALAEIRRKITDTESQVKSKLDSLLRNNKNWFSDGFVSFRNGHYTLPVKREHKNQVSGTVIDVSQSGSTCFVEPAAVRKLQEEIGILSIKEENEVLRILHTLTALVEDHLQSILINIEAMECLDFIFAKAKLSIAMNAVPVPVSLERKIEILDGRHPLLESDNIIPLNFHIGGDSKGIVITGPNTGGKTVALKTIGLLSLMAQSGLHVPASGGCLTMNNYVLADIGDGQSITENLSTFSSHMTNIIRILKMVDDQSLVLLDELGSGTDPAEGMGLAMAIIEELAAKNCLFVATTHYPQIKEYAKNTPGLINARMTFDLQSLMPLFQLEIGEAGESCALYIARRLGLPQRMIERAGIAAYGYTPKFPEEKTPKAEEPDFQKKRVRMKETEKLRNIPAADKFNIGDSVMITPQNIIGIVYERADERGEIGVQIKGKKLMINNKRLKLQVPARELYPDDYDFSIIFDSVENRKRRHIMERKHDPNAVIE